MELQLIAMHGWCGDSRSWDPWLPLWQRRGWHCSRGERGYGGLPPYQPAWAAVPGPKVVIAHSLGTHLMAPAVLEQADALVLLTSFGRFVPAGRDGRRVQAALEGMAAQLAGPDPAAMLQTFLQQVAAPEPAELLQATPATGALPPVGLERLQGDLALIAQSQRLPVDLAGHSHVLLVQAGSDQIVAPQARQALEQELPAADVLTLTGAGHGLVHTPVMAMVIAWLEALEQP